MLKSVDSIDSSFNFFKNSFFFFFRFFFHVDLFSFHYIDIMLFSLIEIMREIIAFKFDREDNNQNVVDQIEMSMRQMQKMRFN